MKTGERPNIHCAVHHSGITSGKVVLFRPNSVGLTDETGASSATQTEPATLCVIVCLAQAFDFIALKEKLPKFNCVRFLRTVIMVRHGGGWSVIHPYGVVVHWNVVADERHQLHLLLLGVAGKSHEKVQEETYTYAVNRPQTRIQQDHIELQSGDPMLLLALSHTMAQSIKLAEFEAQAIKTIEGTRHLPQSLASKGKIKLSRTDTARIRGQLFLTKSDIFLNYGLLDTPDFYWEHPEYEPVYTLAANYFEIRQRTEVLSKKLETIRELLEMLADEQKHQHSSTLEWIIIWLIVVEISFNVCEKLL